MLELSSKEHPRKHTGPRLEEGKINPN
jgi:hypothetical protein